MSAGVQLGLLLAVATAVTSVLGFLYKHRGAVLAPEVEFRRPLRSTFVLFRSGWYTLGIVVALGSWFLHVAALALAPISLVQSVIAGGLVLLTVFADRIFGFTVSRREWVGVALAALGLAFLAATIEGAAQEAHSSFDPAGIGAYIGCALGAGAVMAALALRPPNARESGVLRRVASSIADARGGEERAAIARRDKDGPDTAGRGEASSTAIGSDGHGEDSSTGTGPDEHGPPVIRRHHAGIMLGISAGLMWGGSDIAIKGASADLSDGLALALHPLVWVIVVASLVGLLISARSLQLGAAVPVIAVTSVTANTITIASGPIVFGDPLPEETLSLMLRLSAFAMVIAAAAMTPLPAQAALPDGHQLTGRNEGI